MSDVIIQTKVKKITVEGDLYYDNNAPEGRIGFQLSVKDFSNFEEVKKLLKDGLPRIRYI